MLGLTRAANAKWSCKRCTLANRESNVDCAACGHPRHLPQPEDEEWGSDTTLRKRFNSITCGEDGLVRLWDSNSGKNPASMSGHRGTVWAIDVHWAEHQALTGGADRTIRLWNLERGRLLRDFTGHQGAVLEVTGDWELRRVFSGSTDGTVKIWNMESTECIQTLYGHGGSVTSMAHAWPARLILTGASDYIIRLWDVGEATAGVLREFSGHLASVTCISARWDTERGLPEALSASADSSLRLWDLESGDCPLVLEGHEGSINAISVDWDSRRALSASSDGTVKLWRLDCQGERLRTWKANAGSLFSISANWDSLRFLCGAEEGVVQLWEIGGSWSQLRYLRRGKSGSIYAISFEGHDHSLRNQQWLVALQGLSLSAPAAVVVAAEMEVGPSIAQRLQEAKGAVALELQEHTRPAASMDIVERVKTAQISGGSRASADDDRLLQGGISSPMLKVASTTTQIGMNGNCSCIVALPDTSHWQQTQIYRTQIQQWAATQASDGSIDEMSSLVSTDSSSSTSYRCPTSLRCKAKASAPSSQKAGTKSSASQVENPGTLTMKAKPSDKITATQASTTGTASGAAPKKVNPAATSSAPKAGAKPTPESASKLATKPASSSPVTAGAAPGSAPTQSPMKVAAKAQKNSSSGPGPGPGPDAPVPAAATANKVAGMVETESKPQAAAAKSGPKEIPPKAEAKPAQTKAVAAKQAGAVAPAAPAAAPAVGTAAAGSTEFKPQAESKDAPKVEAKGIATSDQTAKTSGSSVVEHDDAEELQDMKEKALSRGMPKKDADQKTVKELRGWLARKAEEGFREKKILSAWRGPAAAKYEVIKELGNGLEGVAYYVRSREDGKHFCAKECNNPAKAQQEYENLKSMQHQHVLKVVEMTESLTCKGGTWRKESLIVTEIGKGGDLMRYIQQVLASPTNVDITEAWLADLHIQCIEAMRHLHSKNVMHNDIKPENLLVMDAFVSQDPLRVPLVVLADFGLMSSVIPKVFQEGDPRYMSPEGLAVRDDNTQPLPGPKADVWSAGAVLFELLSGGCIPFLYEARNLEEFFALTPQKEDAFYDAVFDAPVEFSCCVGLSQEAQALITDMLAKDANDRPSAEEVLEDPWYDIEGHPLSDGCMLRFEEVAYKGSALKLLLRALSSKLQQDHMKKCWEVFRSVDIDFNLDLDTQEFLEACQKLGKSKEWATKAFDTSGADTLNFDEFSALTFEWEKLDPQAMHSNLGAIVNEMDQDGSGDVDLDELDAYFDGALDTDQLEALMKKIDLGGDGKVNTEEFKAFLFNAKK